MSRRLEDFPNETFLDIFEYLDGEDLYSGFWGINQRLNELLQSLQNLSLTIEKNESQLFSLCSNQILRVVLETSLYINLSQFPLLHSLVFNQLTEKNLEQIIPLHC